MAQQLFPGRPSLDRLDARPEKVDRGDLLEDHALRIGRQVLRNNALALFPQLAGRLWKRKGIRLKPPETAGTPQAAVR